MVEKKFHREKIDACPKGCGTWLDRDELERIAKAEAKQELALKKLYASMKKNGVKVSRFPFKFVSGTLRIAGSSVNNFGKLLTKW